MLSIDLNVRSYMDRVRFGCKIPVKFFSKSGHSVQTAVYEYGRANADTHYSSRGLSSWRAFRVAGFSRGGLFEQGLFEQRTFRVAGFSSGDLSRRGPGVYLINKVRKIWSNPMRKPRAAPMTSTKRNSFVRNSLSSASRRSAEKPAIFSTTIRSRSRSWRRLAT